MLPCCGCLCAFAVAFVLVVGGRLFVFAPRRHHLDSRPLRAEAGRGREERRKTEGRLPWECSIDAAFSRRRLMRRRMRTRMRIQLRMMMMLMRLLSIVMMTVMMTVMMVLMLTQLVLLFTFALLIDVGHYRNARDDKFL